jgi:hypothetical protein
MFSEYLPLLRLHRPRQGRQSLLNPKRKTINTTHNSTQLRIVRVQCFRARLYAFSVFRTGTTAWVRYTGEGSRTMETAVGFPKGSAEHSRRKLKFTVSSVQYWLGDHIYRIKLLRDVCLTFHLTQFETPLGDGHRTQHCAAAPSSPTRHRQATTSLEINRTMHKI